MPRPALHQADDVLDAARDLVLETGPRAVGIREIARRSGAPSGSLYHRFQSRDALVARAWLRAVRRFQAGFIEALESDPPHEAPALAARWAVTFALSHPADAQLLLDYSRSALLDAEPLGPVAEELATVNAPLDHAVKALARRLFGTASREALERTTNAVVDLPYAVLRRHLRARSLGDRTATTLAAAVQALVVDPTTSTPGKGS